MRKTIILIVFIFLFFTSTAGAQILSPIFHLKGNIDEDTKAVFAGKTSITGTYQGYQMDTLLDNPYIEEIDVFPLFGSCTFEDISSLKIIDMDSIDIEL